MVLSALKNVIYRQLRSVMIHVQKGVYTVNEKMTELKSFYKLVKYMWEKLVAVCGERILAFA